MNKKHLAENLNAWVRLRPCALLIDGEGCALPTLDHSWRIEAVTDQIVRLTRIRSGHVLELGLDHVREYRTDFTSNQAGRRGFLMLQSWVLVDPCRVMVEPIHPVQAGSHQLVVPARYQEAIAKGQEREKKHKEAERGKALGSFLLAGGAMWLVSEALKESGRAAADRFPPDS